MQQQRILILALLMVLGTASSLHARQPPSFSKEIMPFFARYCLECHSGEKPKGDLNLESYKNLQQGGKSGEVVVPNKPDESRLVILAEGKDKLVMPPKTAKQPKREEVALLRAWVAAGAKVDAGTIAVTIPDIKTRVSANPPVTCLAYHSNGKILAAGLYDEILFIDPATGDIVGELKGLPGKVTALALSGDGKNLAVAAGATGTAGEVRFYAVAPSGVPAEKPVHTIAAHNDVIYAAAFSPDNKILATASYDRLIKLWDVASGKELRTLKDHSDAVYSLAFSPDGKWLASGAADRAVKIWDVTTGKERHHLEGGHRGAVKSLSFSVDGKRLASGSVDTSILIWDLD